jgi:hypothetical protein
MQGIDEDNDALVYVCSGIQANIPAAASTTGSPQSISSTAEANSVTATTPLGEFLNGATGPAGLDDPNPASVWSLSSRPSAAKKIW